MFRCACGERAIASARCIRLIVVGSSRWTKRKPNVRKKVVAGSTFGRIGGQDRGQMLTVQQTECRFWRRFFRNRGGMCKLRLPVSSMSDARVSKLVHATRAYECRRTIGGDWQGREPGQ